MELPADGSQQQAAPHNSKPPLTAQVAALADGRDVSRRGPYSRPQASPLTQSTSSKPSDPVWSVTSDPVDLKQALYHAHKALSGVCVLLQEVNKNTLFQSQRITELQRSVNPGNAQNLAQADSQHAWQARSVHAMHSQVAVINDVACQWLTSLREGAHPDAMSSTSGFQTPMVRQGLPSAQTPQCPPSAQLQTPPSTYGAVPSNDKPVAATPQHIYTSELVCMEGHPLFGAPAVSVAATPQTQVPNQWTGFAIVHQLDQ